MPTDLILDRFEKPPLTGHPLAFDELDHCNFLAPAQGADNHSERRTGLAFALAGVGAFVFVVGVRAVSLAFARVSDLVPSSYVLENVRSPVGRSSRPCPTRNTKELLSVATDAANLIS